MAARHLASCMRVQITLLASPLSKKSHVRCLCAAKRHTKSRITVQSVRWYSSSSNGGLFRNFVENLRKSLEKDKEIQENLKAFEDERSKIVKSDSVKLFRQQFSNTREWIIKVTLYTVDSTRAGWGKLKERSSQVFSRASESDIGKKGQDVGAQISRSAQQAAQKVSEQAEIIGQTDVYKSVSKSAEVMKEDLLDDIIKESAPYKAPEEVVKRSDRASFTSQDTKDSVVIAADDETKDVTITRQSKWRKKWEELRENNPISNTFYNIKMKYDESDNIAVRASRVVTDRIGDTFGGVVSRSDMAEVLEEIYKVDRNFRMDPFLIECQHEIVPNILESYLRGDLEVLKDWCHEAAFNVLSAIIKQRATVKAAQYRVLDIRDMEVLGGKVLERGPVVVIHFNAQQLTITSGETDTNEQLDSVLYVWALCRDPSIYDPKTAWRVMEFGIQASRPLLV